MYHTTSGISAEVTVHLALIIAGAGGYIFVQWINRNLCPSREKANSKAKAASVEDVVDVQRQPKAAQNKPGKSARGNRRSKQKAAIAETIPESSTCEVAVPQPAIEEDTSTLRREAEPVSDEVVTEEKPELLLESAVAENPIMIDPPVAPMSDRVIRLLAKKAERKARKAQGCLKQESEISQDAAEVIADISPTGSDQDATSELSPVALVDVPTLSVLTTEERELSSEACAPPKTDREQQLACFEAEMEVNIAELSTSDEVLLGVSQSEESTDESLGENPDFDMHSDVDVPPAEASVFEPPHDTCFPPHQVVWTCDEEFQGLYQPVQYDDAWMTPWEQVMRSRDEAECVYQELFDEMCMGTGASQGPEVQFQPVMCENNQQLYTDGEQLYMLACVDVSADAGVATSHLMQPVLDAHDPLHAEFSNELHHDSVQLLVCQ